MTALLITTPTAGVVHTEHYKSMIGLTQALRRKSVKFALKTFEFSDIMTSRNYLMSFFLSQPEYTHCLLVDSDMVFKPEQVFRLIDFDQPFAAAYCPNRRPNWRKIRLAMSEDANKPELDRRPWQQLLAGTQSYVATTNPGNGYNFQRETQGDFETVVTIGTGFMVIKREVPETLVEQKAVRHLPRMGKLPIYAGADRFYDFFSHRFSDDGAFYGEDQSFCMRWTLDCGEKIWADRQSKVDHIGEFTFPGDYAATFEI